MEKFFLKSMGCKSNQLEGFLIEENLIKNGYKKAEKISDADFYILNSCTVTHKSDSEALTILRKIKRDNVDIKTVLTGCIAQVEKENLLKNSDIDFVLGNDEKLEMSKFLKESISCKVDEIANLDFFHSVLLEDTKKTRASLKIQDGCDNRCSYCIIPFARGKNRSADVEFILKQISLYEKAGFREIVLTGIHIGQWGQDFSDSKTLLNLLEQIEENSTIERFRLGSLNPLEIDDKMLNFLAKSKKFCPHFHLSLQSMCDKTLQRMNRHYTVEQALTLIDKIKTIFPLAFIGSDIIAGFVGESEDDFNVTVSNLRKSQLSQIHTFPYSIRKNTQAEKLEGHLGDEIKAVRAQVIKEISAQKYSMFIEQNLGSIQEVLVEKNPDKKTEMLKGVTRNYLTVLIDPKGLDLISQKDCYNSIRLVRIKSLNPILADFI